MSTATAQAANGAVVAVIASIEEAFSLLERAMSELEMLAAQPHAAATSV